MGVVPFESLADAIQEVMGTDPRSLKNTLDTTMARAALLIFADQLGIPSEEVRGYVPSGEYYRLKSIYGNNEYLANVVFPKVRALLSLLEKDPN